MKTIADQITVLPRVSGRADGVRCSLPCTAIPAPPQGSGAKELEVAVGASSQGISGREHGCRGSPVPSAGVPQAEHDDCEWRVRRLSRNGTSTAHRVYLCMTR